MDSCCSLTYHVLLRLSKSLDWQRRMNLIVGGRTQVRHSIIRSILLDMLINRKSPIDERYAVHSFITMIIRTHMRDCLITTLHVSSSLTRSYFLVPCFAKKNNKMEKEQLCCRCWRLKRILSAKEIDTNRCQWTSVSSSAVMFNSETAKALPEIVIDWENRSIFEHPITESQWNDIPWSLCLFFLSSGITHHNCSTRSPTEQKIMVPKARAMTTTVLITAWSRTDFRSKN